MDQTVIDEINMYNNGDGTYTIDINFTYKKAIGKWTIPNAMLNLDMITSICNGTKIELSATGELLNA